MGICINCTLNRERFLGIDIGRRYQQRHIRILIRMGVIQVDKLLKRRVAAQQWADAVDERYRPRATEISRRIHLRLARLIWRSTASRLTSSDAARCEGLRWQAVTHFRLRGEFSCAGHVRSECIVPSQRREGMVKERPVTGRNHDLLDGFHQRTNDTIHHGITAVLSYCAIAERNASRLAPLLVILRHSNCAPWSVIRYMAQHRQLESFDPGELGSFTWPLVCARCKSLGSMGEMIDDHGDPPAERPTLRKGVP